MNTIANTATTGRGRTLSKLTLAAAAGLCLSLAGAPAQAAGTAEETGDCPFPNTLCLFDGTDFTGERFTVAPLRAGQGVCVDLVAHGWGDRALSAISTAPAGAAAFLSDDCTGGPMHVPSGPTPDLSFSPNSVFVS